MLSYGYQAIGKLLFTRCNWSIDAVSVGQNEDLKKKFALSPPFWLSWLNLACVQTTFLLSQTLSIITPPVSQSAAPPLAYIICLLLWSMPVSQILPRHICRQVMNVTLLHQRIIKCQVMPWQRNVMAESQWCGGGVVRVEELPGGRACWEGSMAHLTPACPLLNRARPLTPLTHSPPGNEIVQLLQMSVHSRMQPLVMICWCMTSEGGDEMRKVYFLLSD